MGILLSVHPERGSHCFPAFTAEEMAPGIFRILHGLLQVCNSNARECIDDVASVTWV